MKYRVVCHLDINVPSPNPTLHNFSSAFCVCSILDDVFQPVDGVELLKMEVWPSNGGTEACCGSAKDDGDY